MSDSRTSMNPVDARATYQGFVINAGKRTHPSSVRNRRMCRRCGSTSARMIAAATVVIDKRPLRRRTCAWPRRRAPAARSRWPNVCLRLCTRIFQSPPMPAARNDGLREPRRMPDRPRAWQRRPPVASPLRVCHRRRLCIHRRMSANRSPCRAHERRRALGVFARCISRTPQTVRWRPDPCFGRRRSQVAEFQSRKVVGRIGLEPITN
jgi:hypothetical protein